MDPSTPTASLVKRLAFAYQYRYTRSADRRLVAAVRTFADPSNVRTPSLATE